MASGADLSFVVRREIGGWGLTLSVEDGEVWTGALNGEVAPGRTMQRHDLRSFGVAADRRFGGLTATLGMSWMRESDTVLGARFAPALGGTGADSAFVDLDAAWTFGDGWRLGGSWREGYTSADRGGLITAGSDFRSRGWAFDLHRAGVFGRGDSLGFRLSQPLRVSGGGLNLDLPVGYDYASQSAQFGVRHLSLAPEGRETTGELAWRTPLWSGQAAASVFYRDQPDHVAAAPADAGVALRWDKRF